MARVVAQTSFTFLCCLFPAWRAIYEMRINGHVDKKQSLPESKCRGQLNGCVG